jgi:hypothetical protein
VAEPDKKCQHKQKWVGHTRLRVRTGVIDVYECERCNAIGIRITRRGDARKKVKWTYPE